MRQLPATPNTAPRERVLLADDNADMRSYLTRILGEHYEVLTAANGEEALAQAIRSPPDLILSDVMMPRLDGFGLLSQLRANPGTKTIPVVLVSARAGEESRVGGLQAGADDFLVKPFTARELQWAPGNGARPQGGRSIARNQRRALSHHGEQRPRSHLDGWARETLHLVQRALAQIDRTNCRSESRPWLD
jgi:DNA-binding response OmpR family regulator